MFSAHCPIKVRTLSNKSQDIKLYAQYALSFILKIMPRELYVSQLTVGILGC